MKYDDLINVPYKAHGRSKEEGFDCYGLAVEMCRRAGTPLLDLYYTEKVPAEEVIDYIRKGINIRQTEKPKIGGLCECVYKGNAHMCYIVGRDLVIHATYDKGVRVSPMAVLKPIAYYEVINESDNL